MNKPVLKYWQVKKETLVFEVLKTSKDKETLVFKVLKTSKDETLVLRYWKQVMKKPVLKYWQVKIKKP